MPNDAKPESQCRPIAVYVAMGAALFAFIQSFALLAPILLSFLLTLLIALALNPVISRLRAWTGGRKRAAGVVTVAMVLLLALTAWGIYRPMKAAVFKLSTQLPAYWDRLQKPLIKIEQQAVRSEERLQAEVITETRQNASAATKPQSLPATTKPALPKPRDESGSLRSNLRQALQGVAGSFAAMAFNAAAILVVLVTVFFGVIFTLMNPRPIFGALFLLVPERHHDRALTIAQRVGDFVPRWAGATLLGMLTIGLLVFLLMWPIFGFFDALLLGLIAGILEAIPYVGPLLSAVPALLLALGEGGMTPLWVVLAYIAIQALENNVVTPIIMSRGAEVHPVALIFSMLLCLAAFGVLGVLVAAPLVAIVRILHEELYRKRFLPTTTDASLDRLARKALHERVSDDP